MNSVMPAPSDAGKSDGVPAAAARTALMASPDPVWLVDGEGAVHAANGAGVDAIASDRLIGHALAEIAGTARDDAAAARGSWVIGEGESLREVSVAALPAGDDRFLVVTTDVTAERRLRDALIDSRRRYRALVDASGGVGWEVDAEGRFSFVSAPGLAGHPPVALSGRPASTLCLDAEDACAFAATRPVDHRDLWIRAADGAAVCLRLAAQPRYDSMGRYLGALGLAHDVTEEHRRGLEEAQMRLRERTMLHLMALLRDESDPAAMLSAAASVIRRATGAAGCLIVAAEGEAGRPVAADGAVTPPDGLVGRVSATAGPVADGTWLACPARFRGAVVGIVVVDLGRPAAGDAESAILLDAVAGQLGIALRQRADQAALERLSRTDDLTGLLNRRAFFDGLESGLARARRDGATGALLYVDLDNFKAVNDTHGHEAGDDVLRTLASILTHAVRRYDLAARLGGDEFALWLDGIDGEQALGRARTILERCGALVRLSASDQLPLSVSIGLAPFSPADHEPLEALVVRADHAMYDAKRAGKNGVAMAPPPVPRAAPVRGEPVS